MVNGKQENEFYLIQEGDAISVQNCYTVVELAAVLDVPVGGDIKVNDAPAKETTKVYENFSVSWDMSVERGTWSGETTSVDGMSYEDLPEDDGVEESFDDSEIAEAKTTESDTENDEEQKTEEVKSGEVKVMANGHLVTLSGKDNYVFVDIFDHIDFDLKESNGRGITTLLNSKAADYMEALKDGDVIEIFWNESGK